VWKYGAGRLRMEYCRRKRATDVKHGVASASVRWQSSFSGEITFKVCLQHPQVVWVINGGWCARK